MHSLLEGDYLELLNSLPETSIDLVLCDLPYGMTDCAWDKVIPMDRLWSQYKRLLRPNGRVVLTACMRFAVDLIASSPKGWFRHDLVWDKVVVTGFLDAKRRPMRRHEHVLVFSPKGLSCYNPQLTVGEPYKARAAKGKRSTSVYGDFKDAHTENKGTRYPTSIIRASNSNAKGKHHPTEKPLELCDWLVKTYSNPGAVILDNTMGSGSFGVSALRLGRSFIGIERDPGFFQIAKTRVTDAAPKTEGLGPLILNLAVGIP